MATTQDLVGDSPAKVQVQAQEGRPRPGSKGHPRELRERAAAMRRDGVSRAAIARELRVGFSTVARWFREDGVASVTVPGASPRGPGSSYRRTVDERWAHQQAEQDAHRDSVGELSERELLLVGAALYWAEGSKAKPWRRDHFVSFINSDPGMVRVFLAYLDTVGVGRDRLSCHLSIHESADVEAATDYWREIVGPDAQFNRAVLKRHRTKTLRGNTGGDYHGCLVVYVARGGSIYRKIAGTWEAISAARSKT